MHSLSSSASHNIFLLTKASDPAIVFVLKSMQCKQLSRPRHGKCVFVGENFLPCVENNTCITFFSVLLQSLKIAGILYRGERHDKARSKFFLTSSKHESKDIWRSNSILNSGIERENSSSVVIYFLESCDSKWTVPLASYFFALKLWSLYFVFDERNLGTWPG